MRWCWIFAIGLLIVEHLRYNSFILRERLRAHGMVTPEPWHSLVAVLSDTHNALTITPPKNSHGT